MSARWYCELFWTPFSCRLFSPLCAPGVSRTVFSPSRATLFSPSLCAPPDARLFSPLCGWFFSRLCGRLFSRRLFSSLFSPPLFAPSLCARFF